jgi:hypothetical protein
LDSAGAVVRTFASGAPRAAGEVAGSGGMPGAGVGSAGAEEEEGPPRARPTPRLPIDAGLNRHTWDLSYPGPIDPSGQPVGNGPTAVPGRYQVRLTVDGKSQTQSLVLRADPRVTKDGVTLADMRDQFQHNMRVRDLVSDAYRVAARIRVARARLKDATGAAADTLQMIRVIESRLLTPPIRYSTPGLQAHITYLYSLTNQADQKVGRDARERYNVLRQALDGVIVETNRVLTQP